jgi:hypothetical protein
MKEIKNCRAVIILQRNSKRDRPIGIQTGGSERNITMGDGKNITLVTVISECISRLDKSIQILPVCGRRPWHTRVPINSF